jgi:hypothetical protein
MAKKMWIQEALSPASKGKLHKQMGVPAGKKIPVGKLEKAAKKGGVLGKRANLALTLRSFKRGK